MVIFYYILWTLSLALKLSVLRWAEMIFFGPRGNTWSETLNIIVTGFRFDLMIVGFWLAPIVVYLIISEFLSNQGLLKPLFAKIYLWVSWLFICALYFKDLVSYPFQKDRLWWSDHLQYPLLNWNHAGDLQWWAWVGIILLTIGLFQAGALRFSSFVQRFQKVGFFSLGFIFLWTALISRGTVTEHHLRRKDCQFSRDSRVESICLNPVFTFSKNK